MPLVQFNNRKWYRIRSSALLNLCIVLIWTFGLPLCHTQGWSVPGCLTSVISPYVSVSRSPVIVLFRLCFWCNFSLFAVSFWTYAFWNLYSLHSELEAVYTRMVGVSLSSFNLYWFLQPEHDTEVGLFTCLDTIHRQISQSASAYRWSATNWLNCGKHWTKLWRNRTRGETCK